MRVDQPFIQHLLPIVHNLLYFRIIGQIDGDGINDESNKTAPPPYVNYPLELDTVQFVPA